MLPVDVSNIAYTVSLLFQRAPTLGGECYSCGTTYPSAIPRFQRAPTLGGECYALGAIGASNAVPALFQRAPTLGGECYYFDEVTETTLHSVSKGTHPWG